MHGVDTVTGCDGGVETVVVMAVGAAVLVAAVVVLCLVSGEKSAEGDEGDWQGRGGYGRGGRSEV